MSIPSDDSDNLSKYIAKLNAAEEEFNNDEKNASKDIQEKPSVKEVSKDKPEWADKKNDDNNEYDYKDTLSEKDDENW